MPLGASRLNFLSKTLGPAVEYLDAVALGSPASLSYYSDTSITNTLSDNPYFTLSAWVKPTLTGHTSSRWSPFALYASGAGAIVFVSIQDDGDIRFYGVGVEDYTWTGAISTADQWYHMLLVVDGINQTAKLYINGSEVSGTPSVTAANFNYDTVGEVYVGGITTGQAEGDEITQVWFSQTLVDDIDAFYDTTNDQAISLGASGTATGLNQPAVYHVGDSTDFVTTNGDTSLLNYTLSLTGTSATSSQGPEYNSSYSYTSSSEVVAPAGSNWNNYDGTADGSYTQLVNGGTDIVTPNVAMFDDTYGIATYVTNSGNKDVYYRTVTVSGTGITLGTATDTGIDADNVGRCNIVKLSSTRIVFQATYDASPGYAVVFNHSGGGSVSVTTSNLTSGGSTANSICSLVRLSDTTYAHIGRRSGTAQPMGHFEVNTGTDAVTQTGSITSLNDFDQYMAGVRIDNDTMFMIGRNASNTSKHSYGVYDWSGTAWSRNGSLGDVVTHNGQLVARQSTNENTTGVHFFAEGPDNAGEVGITLYCVDYNGGSPQVSTGLTISEATLTANADGPEGGESWYYATSLRSVQPDPDNNPNVYVLFYEIRQSDNYQGRETIVFVIEHNPGSNTISLYNGDYYSLNGRVYRYGYVMGQCQDVIDANRIISVTAEDDHTRNGPYDYDPGLIVIKDET